MRSTYLVWLSETGQTNQSLNGLSTVLYGLLGHKGLIGKA